MTPTAIFVLQFAISLLAFSLLAVWYAAPWLAGKTTTVALSILVLPHAFRHIGMSFLVPSLNSGMMPEAFSTAAGYGDLAAAVMAIGALAAMHWGSTLAIPLIWVFNIAGVADLLNALRQAEAIDHFGSTWFIPTFLVPLLLVTHVMIFVRLFKGAEINENAA